MTRSGARWQRIGPERELSQLAALRQTKARKIISSRFACPRAADWDNPRSDQSAQIIAGRFQAGR